MLELKNIKKEYPAGDGNVHALKGIDLQFRRNEFVAILGPSGCGKTTMLNIIGGLDQYTSGDLIINGVSTKNYKDRDWDTYRNHSIGFVFQSYNLIPHQTVLQNVELALTLTGVSKAERRERAKQALEQVGLGNQLKKKPSQMSGGQMQRVAIARALVNNPDIILADEPTGALDTETSVQVMEILKEISKDKLIIMVTHNPELAEQYATRIIRMLDGELKSDSMPLDEKEKQLERAAEKAEASGKKKEKKPSMSFPTAFSLSLKNLISKRGRTILTSFAGSIGIIGIALIFAVSRGMTAYIDLVQESTLSSYPLTIEATTLDMGSLLESFIGAAEAKEEHETDAVYTKPVIYDMVNMLNSIETTENDLKSFKEYIETERANQESETGLQEALSGVQYTYNLDMQVYTQNVDGTIIPSDTNKLLTELMMEFMGAEMASLSEASMAPSSASMMGGGMMMGGAKLWQEMLPGKDGSLINDILEKQYDVIYGSWPNSYNEVVLVVDQNNELSDMTLYALGLVSKDYMDVLMESALEGTTAEVENKHWTYEEICDMEFRAVLNSSCYSYDINTGLYTDLRETDTGLKYLYDNAIPLKVSGIIRQNEDADAAMLTGSIAYTSKLTEYVIEHSRESEAVTAQLESPTIDIFTNLPFEENSGRLSKEEKEAALREYLGGLDSAEKAKVYVEIMSIPTEEQLAAAVEQGMMGMDRATMESVMLQAFTQQMGMSENEIKGYFESMTDEDITSIFAQMVAEQVKMQFAAQVQQQMAALSEMELAAALDFALPNFTTEQCAVYYDEVLEFSRSSYDYNLQQLGYIDLDDPASINLYAASFENKDIIEAAIEKYNEGVDEVSQIKYVDYVGLMMSSVTSIINTITYVLIAFVAISLVVSSIMIGVITLISVQERTKEIGILRAMGASKRDVSSMFNAETIIIGFTSGALGVLVTYLLCIPINAVIHALTGINNLNAYLPVEVAIILVVISMLLTVFSGLIPSRSAAKKDPVVALRTE
ncbi:MAG: ABC transporter ATP-binding protein/permease [Lachnospiraceae bacterium]|nr:ABC transporter ATP-binding protein/permease [Lachnospiraceae bacterium]